MDRRKFLSRFSGLSTGVFIAPFWSTAQGNEIQSLLSEKEEQPPQALAVSETFWAGIRSAYSVSSEVINLNNGGVSPQPKVVQEAVRSYENLANELPSFNLWRVIDQDREPLREQLAEMAGCTAEELALNRNATEGIETVIFGLPLKTGDEVVLSKYDYPSMIHAWQQRELRDGIVLRWVDLDVPMHDEDEIVKRYQAACSDKTKLVHVTHLMNWTGQLVPVGKIGKWAQEEGYEVMVDGAHSFGHFDFKISDLHCDYFATSLHKWLCAPFGTGFVYIRKEKISKVFPLFASPDPLDDNIRKFEHLGTRSLAIEMGTLQAIEFHKMIGIERKAARLLYLKEYWTEQIKDAPGIMLKTDTAPAMSAGMALISVGDIHPSKVSNYLLRDYNILISPVNHEKASGIRVSPHVYTQLSELDRFVEAVKAIAKG